MMRPGDRQGPSARAIRGDCPSRLEGALPRVRAASQKDGPARAQLGAQPRFGHLPAGPRCGFAQVPGPGGGRAGAATRRHTLCLGVPLGFQRLGVLGLGAWTQTSSHRTRARREFEGAGTGRGGHSGREFGVRGWGWPRGLRRSGAWGSARSPGKTRRGQARGR